LGEKDMVDSIFNNEIDRQEYMEYRYKSIDEEQFKPDTDDIFENKAEKIDENQETELKYMEEAFLSDKIKILEELGLLVANNDAEKEKDGK
jgi:hypothetical protein